VAGLSGSAEARGHVFSALAQLTQRLPDLFQVRFRQLLLSCFHLIHAWLLVSPDTCLAA
jgi:hypothetical protein